ncbi:helix-turn-helix domain-containing protein [Mycolicibacterium austroafricanum]|uniref:helix-turn-helix domain-containing protein n=1 Tax=Mycolicibacterium austroafricanum TaxID=39687 RepID=UPI001CA34029|nr:helix-turn-helix transcriptional regulator [Mycolicibacterium austroafricanum]QZT57115.1 helix-turn-helix transcriptional regulator [Mycolicibacterium austroafricanum]
MQPGRPRKEDVPYQERRAELRKILKSRRELLKYSRKELSARSGVSASTIQAIEDGRVVDPGLFTVISLGVALRIDLGPMMRSLTGPIDPQPLIEPAETPTSVDGVPSRAQ